MLTRRCYQRTFRLRPCEETNHIFQYVLAWAAAKTGVEIHALCVMSNHYHVVLTDVAGRLPDFARELHRTVAKALNAAQGQWENLWSAEPYHSLELGAPQDVLDKVAYLAANPVEAGLVESPEEWPGLMLLPGSSVQTFEIPRPTKYFTDDSVFPEVVVVGVSPVASTERSTSELFGRVVDAIQHTAARARNAVVAEGRAFLGRAAVLGQSFAKRAKSFEPKRGPIPQVRARNRALLRALVSAHRVFRMAYHAAFAAWRGGDRSAVFPFGTWAMRVVYGASVAVTQGATRMSLQHRPFPDLPSGSGTHLGSAP